MRFEDFYLNGAVLNEIYYFRQVGAVANFFRIAAGCELIGETDEISHPEIKYMN